MVCLNRVTINGDISNLVETELNREGIIIYAQDTRHILFVVQSVNCPHHEWFHKLLEKYPDIWIKVEWQNDEKNGGAEGYAGIWIIHMNEHMVPEIHSMDWKEYSIYGIFR